MKKSTPFYLFIFSLILLNIFLIFNCTKKNYNSNNFFRMHIVANSNSINDQITKLNVAKKVNKYIENLIYKYNITDITETENIITNNINSILKIANNELSTQNSNYKAYAKIGKIKYDEKKAGTLSMDKGIYDSLQIVLGDGKGENFWSLIFPYSCNENYNIEDNVNILKENIQIKLKIIEDIKKATKYLVTL